MTAAGRNAWVVGIDLGTTHTVVAYAAPDVGAAIHSLAVEQLTGERELGQHTLLPSALYRPLAAETFAKGAAVQGWCVGQWARRRSGEVSERSILSTKSWLSHAAVERRAEILPWRLASAPEDAAKESEVPRISPVTASEIILRHVVRGWSRHFPERPLGEQQVVLTVPASFDAVARQLTVEAAARCGLSVRLLEEPQAAFYDVLERHGDDCLEAALTTSGDGAVLVCDVGGGTTDLSLMQLQLGADNIVIDRVAVGGHLLLGGDNMDLALAQLCEQLMIGDGDALSPRRYAQLVERCRAAKERLLSDGAPEHLKVSLLGQGAKLMGAGLSCRLTKAQVEEVVLEGFLPVCSLDSRPQTKQRAALTAFGLPYERDVAITRHLAHFVSQNQAAVTPTALLFNGGVFQPLALRERITETLKPWLSGELAILPLADPLTSVARGAVSYGLSLVRGTRRIRGGSPVSYFIGLGGQPARAMCVLPKGTDEEQPQRVRDRVLELRVGEQVRFPLYSAAAHHALGALLTADDEGLTAMPALLATMSAEADCAVLPVTLQTNLSAIGTLELACMQQLTDGERRFELAFDLHPQRRPAGSGLPPRRRPTAGRQHGQRLPAALAHFAACYGKNAAADPRSAKALLRDLEKLFGKRGKWDAALLRTLFDGLWQYRKGRRKSLDHERMFWLLAGYCLRPGWGDVRDGERCAALFSLFSQKLTHNKERRAWQQFWIAWRRVAGGLDGAAHIALRDVLDAMLAPAELRLKKVKAYRNDAALEMLDLASCLERAPSKRRAELGSWVLERTWTERDQRLWLALGRIGARVPSYASAHHAVSARSVERWMDHLLREKWEQVGTAARAAVAMCRITGDRSRDVSQATRAQVLKRLENLDVEARLLQPLREWIPLDDIDRAEMLGDALPAGLKLAGERPVEA